MSSPASLITSNLVMESVEVKPWILFKPPWFWRRFVDGSFVIMKENQINHFFNHINQIEDNSKFIIKEEDNNFLNVMVTKSNERSLQTKVYRKRTGIDWQLLKFQFLPSLTAQMQRSKYVTSSSQVSCHLRCWQTNWNSTYLQMFEFQRIPRLVLKQL